MAESRTTPVAEHPVEQSVERRALRGVPWTVGSFIVSRGLQLVGTLVIARLVPPADVGVVLTGLIVVSALNLLSENGMSTSLVMRSSVDDRLAGTVLTLMLGLSVALAALAWPLAAPISAAFGAPRLASVLPLLALTVVTSTMVWILMGLLQREMLWKVRFAGQFALAAGYVIVAIPLAALGAGVWCMVAGQIAAGVLATIVLLVGYPHPLRLQLHRREARIAIHESRPYVSQAATSFLGDNLHFVAVSALLGSRAMALYTMSFRLSELPTRALAVPVAEATVPAYVRLRDEPGRAATALWTSMRFVALAGVAPLAVLAATAPDFVAVVFGPKWQGMDGILALLCAWGALATVEGTLGWFVNANGGARFMAKMNLLRLVTITPLLFAAVAVTKSLEVVGGFACADAALQLLLLIAYGARRLSLPWASFLRALRLPLAAAAVCFGVILAVRLELDATSVPLVARLLGEIAAGVVAYALAVCAIDRSAITGIAGLARRAAG
jgi:O-antigen/teichoic acid export membrane protein